MGDAIEVSSEEVDEEPDSSISTEVDNTPPLPAPELEEATAEIAPQTSTAEGATALPEGYEPIRIEDPSAIPDPLPLARSLRPFLRWTDCGEPRILDEVATVDRIARTGIAQLALRPERELMFDVALVFDTSPSMALWLRLSKDIRRLLSRYGEFRNLYQWKLIVNDSGELGLQSPRRETVYPTSRLCTNDRRRVVLVMSDCMAPFWQRQGIRDVLQDWSRSMPTAIVQVLPEHLWRRTALGRASAVQLHLAQHYDRVGVPSQDLAATAHSFLERRRIASASKTAALRLPIVSLEPQPLRTWAQLVAGDRQVRVPGVLWELPDPKRSEPSLPPPNPGQEQPDRVDIFLRTSSPTARELAALLAASPLVILPIVRLIQRALLPRSRSFHVAEVFASGLFSVASADPPTLENAETVIYQLVKPEYRSRLLEPLPSIDRVLVIEKVSDYIVRGLGTSMSAFRALLRDPRRAAEGASDSEQAVNFFNAFATVTAEVLRGLGPQFDAFAQSLEAGQRLQEVLPSGLELVEFDGEAAIFERDRSIVLEPCEYESAETLYLLKRFEFDTATIEISRSFLGRFGRRPVITRRRAANWGYTEALSDDLGLDLMRIPAGTFMMGSPDDEPERDSDESPQHEVNVPEFYLGRYAITQAQWREVASYPQIDRELDPEPSDFKGDNRPVEQVNWDDAQEFCQRLSAKTGKTYRLPSEAEWEYACRAGTTTPFHYGDLITTELANYNGNGTYNNGPKGEYREQTTDVGLFPSNAWGLHDMYGNVDEWCEDDWHESYEGSPADGSAWIEENRTESDRRLLRGGSWNLTPRYCRSAYRVHRYRDSRYYFIGFRVACDSPRAL